MAKIYELRYFHSLEYSGEFTHYAHLLENNFKEIADEGRIIDFGRCIGSAIVEDDRDCVKYIFYNFLGERIFSEKCSCSYTDSDFDFFGPEESPDDKIEEVLNSKDFILRFLPKFLECFEK